MTKPEDMDARWIVDRVMSGTDRGQLEDLAPDELGDETLIAYLEGSLDAESTRSVWRQMQGDAGLRARLVSLGERWEQPGADAATPGRPGLENVVPGPGSWRRGWRAAVAAAAVLVCVAAGFGGGHARGVEDGKRETYSSEFFRLVSGRSGVDKTRVLVTAHRELRAMMETAAELGIEGGGTDQGAKHGTDFDRQARLFLNAAALVSLKGLSEIREQATAATNRDEAERLLRRLEARFFPR